MEFQIKNENNPFKWKETEVSNFIGGLPCCKEYVEAFKIHEIDGQALMLLKKYHLISCLKIKPSSAMEIMNALEAMRDELKRSFTDLQLSFGIVQ